MMLKGLTTSEMGRIPPAMQDAIIKRCEWSLCTMEHSRIGPIQIDDPGAPFHHIALPLNVMPVKMGMNADGRSTMTHCMPNSLSMIEAGVAGSSWWDDPFEAACFYFTSESLGVALGDKIDAHDIRTTASLHAPDVSRLLRALHADAATGQMHGTLVGDSIFVAIAALLAPSKREWLGRASPGSPDWRVRRALEYIHTYLSGAIDIGSISAAAGTSPFHLSRLFMQAMGVSIWRYVLRERARHAAVLMHGTNLTLLQISHAAGFETYPSFITAIRSEFGHPPSTLRKSLPHRQTARPD